MTTPAYILDSNIFDKIADDREAFALVERLVGDGSIRLLSTHIHRDEIANISDKERVKKLMEVPVEEVPTFGMIVGVSRIGMARLGPAEPLETLRAGEDRATRTHDALITMTAQFELATLVSEDGDLRRRAEKQGITALRWEAFRTRLLEHADETRTPAPRKRILGDSRRAPGRRPARVRCIRLVGGVESSTNGRRGFGIREDPHGDRAHTGRRDGQPGRARRDREAARRGVRVAR